MGVGDAEVDLGDLHLAFTATWLMSMGPRMRYRSGSAPARQSAHAPAPTLRKSLRTRLIFIALVPLADHSWGHEKRDPPFYNLVSVYPLWVGLEGFYVSFSTIFPHPNPPRKGGESFSSPPPLRGRVFDRGHSRQPFGDMVDSFEPCLAYPWRVKRREATAGEQTPRDTPPLL